MALDQRTIVSSLCVLAGVGVPAFAFSLENSFAADAASTNPICYQFIANGISDPPIFTVDLTVDPEGLSNSWVNDAGSFNEVYFWNDGLGGNYYQIVNGGPAGTPVYPTPIGFEAENGGTALTVTFAGVALGAVTPPVDAFLLRARRASLGPLATPYHLASVSPLSTGATSVVFNIGGGVFEPGDIVTLSYHSPSPLGPLQDVTGIKKCFPWAPAPVTVSG